MNEKEKGVGYPTGSDDESSDTPSGPLSPEEHLLRQVFGRRKKAAASGPWTIDDPEEWSEDYIKDCRKRSRRQSRANQRAERDIERHDATHHDDPWVGEAIKRTPRA